MIATFPQRPSLKLNSRPKSPQVLVNEAVAPLHVVCLGVDGNTLIFKRTPRATGSPEDLLNKISATLAKSEVIRNAMAHRITSLTLF